MSADVREAKSDIYVHAGKVFSDSVPQYKKLIRGSYGFLAERSTLIKLLEHELDLLDSLPATREVVSLQAQYYRFLRNLYLRNGDLKMQLLMSLDLLSTCFSYDDVVITDADMSFSQADDLVNYLKANKESLEVPDKTIVNILDLFARVSEGGQVSAEEILRAQLLLQSTHSNIAPPVSDMDSSSSNAISTSSLALDANSAPAAIQPPDALNAGPAVGMDHH